MYLRLLLILSFLLPVGGCRHTRPKSATLPVISTATDPHAEQSKLTRKTRFAGDYELYKIARPEIVPDSVDILIETVHLEADVDIGFAEKADGGFLAVAGDRFIPIDSTRHDWRRMTLTGEAPWRVRAWKEITDIGFGATIITLVVTPLAIFVGVAVGLQILGYEYNPWKLLFK